MEDFPTDNNPKKKKKNVKLEKEKKYVCIVLAREEMMRFWLRLWCIASIKVDINYYFLNFFWALSCGGVVFLMLNE